MQLTPHFGLYEFEVGSRGGRVPPGVVPRVQCLCAAVLEPIRCRWGKTRVTSGFRPGEAPSQHAMAEAADIYMVEADRNEVFA